MIEFPHKYFREFAIFNVVGKDTKSFNNHPIINPLLWCIKNLKLTFIKKS
jgi:hypothetical protein